jgi:hypothetical protein
MKLRITLLSMMIVAVSTLSAEDTDFQYATTIVENVSTGNFAPYMIGSWQGGRYTQKNGYNFDLYFGKALDLNRKLSWSAGAELLAGVNSDAEYDRYLNDVGEWSTTAIGPNFVRIQQLWGQLKYRSLYLLGGMKERESRIVDGRMSSGDLVRSNNARPIPGISAGFIDFQDVPYTNGWVQIEGELTYGKFADSNFTEKQYNHYSYLLSQNIWYTYKRCYFRSMPTLPLVVTIGMQAAGQFAGETTYYTHGRIYRQNNRGFHLRDLWDMFFPQLGNGEGYYLGNSLGSWDFKAQYKLCNGNTITAYFEGPWEDGSGIARRNGTDGLWGLQFDFAKRGIVNAVTFELLDFRNQSGPFHYAPGDVSDPSLSTEATGGDNYYNNDVYGAYSYYGMSIGSPFLLSPLYNLDGYPGYAHNRASGMHMAVSGSINDELDYRAMFSHQSAWGSGRYPVAHPLKSNSLMVEASWQADCVLQGLSMRAQLAADFGKLRGDNVGVSLAVRYAGNLTIKSKTR